MRGNYEKAGPQQCYPTYTKQFMNKGRYQQFSKNRLCNSSRSSSNSSNSNARIRENRHRRYRKCSRGGCLPGCSVAKARSSEGEPITGTASVSGAASASDSTEREEGEETDKYTVIICNTEYAMLTCSAGLPKDMSKSFSYFRIKVEFNNWCIGTIHLPEPG